MQKGTSNSIVYVLQNQVTRFMVEDRFEIELFCLTDDRDELDGDVEENEDEEDRRWR